CRAVDAPGGPGVSPGVSYQRRPKTSVGSSSSTGTASTGMLASMWCAVFRSVRPEKRATAATPRRTTTPAPVRGRVWLGARVGAVAGAADWEPCALRGAALAVVVVVVVLALATGGEVLTRGAFSHGGHGAS